MATAITRTNGSDGFDSSHVGFDSQAQLGQFIRFVIALALRNIWLIAAVVGLFVAAAVVLTMLQSPQYTAEVSVQINDQSDDVLGDELGSSNNAAAAWDIERFLNTQIEILQSRALAERVAKRLNLYDNERFLNAMGAGDLSEGTPRELREKMVEGMLRANMAANLPRETRIARITFTSSDPALAAEIANVYGEEFIQADLARKYDSSSYAREFVGDQLEEARARLEASERELNTYARGTGLIRLRGTDSDGETTATSVTASSLTQLNAAANAAQAERVAAEARWNSERAQPLLASQNVLSNSTVQSLMTRRSELRSQLQAQQARYLDDYPPIVELREQIQALDAQIEQVARNVRESIRSEYVAAAAAEDRLRQQVNSLQGATLAEQDRAVRYNTLAREADTNRSLYDGLLQRFRELNAASGITTSNLAIIDRAEVPSVPSSPNLLRNILVGLLLGMCVAAAAVFARFLMDDAIRVPEDVEEKGKIALLGVIPTAGAEGPDEELQDPKSPMSEAYNSLRGSLLYATPEGLPKLLLVTSSQASEGKSTTSIALARGFARVGKSVVIVDADMRRPSLHRRFGFGNERGLSDLLTSSMPFADALKASGDERLSVIPAGPIPPSPTELISSGAFAARVEDLCQAFDCVIIDSPPIMGLADAPVMAALADGVVFVAESGVSRRRGLRASMRRLAMMNANVLGGVLTKFDAGRGAHRYSQYYGYEYYSYRQGDGAAG